MPRLAPIKPYRLIKIAHRLGFVQVRQTGSHQIFEHADGRRVTIPFHASQIIDRKLLSQIIKLELKMELEEFQKLLESFSANKSILLKNIFLSRVFWQAQILNRKFFGSKFFCLGKILF